MEARVSEESSVAQTENSGIGNEPTDCNVTCKSGARQNALAHIVSIVTTAEERSKAQQPTVIIVVTVT